MHFLSSPCHKSLLKGVICLHEKLWLNLFFLFFPLPLSACICTQHLHRTSVYTHFLIEIWLIILNAETVGFSPLIAFCIFPWKENIGKENTWKSSSDYKKKKVPMQTQGMMHAKYWKGSHSREINPSGFFCEKMLRSTCRAMILIFASGSMALSHYLLTSTFWWQP